MTDIDKIRYELRRHAYLYYTLCQPQMTDYDYDMLFKKLEAIEREHPELVTPDSPTQCVGGKSAKMYEDGLDPHDVNNDSLGRDIEHEL